MDIRGGPQFDGPATLLPPRQGLSPPRPPSPAPGTGSKRLPPVAGRGHDQTATEGLEPRALPIHNHWGEGAHGTLGPSLLVRSYWLGWGVGRGWLVFGFERPLYRLGYILSGRNTIHPTTCLSVHSCGQFAAFGEAFEKMK